MAPELGCTACRRPASLLPFSMAFQPIVDLQDHTIDAQEALVRGPAGEAAGAVLGQVNAGNRYAFDQACRVKAIELATSLNLTQRLNINFLPNAVYEPKACIRLTLETARRTGFPLNRLTFEFTENEQIVDSNHTKSIIEEYRRQGFKIALDDFATSYSGLARLADLKPDIIKLDRALINNCNNDKIREAIIASMVALGGQLGIKVVAEGAERRAEVETLRATGIRFVQGYYFSKPVFEGIARDSDICWTPRGAAADGDDTGAAFK